MTERICSIETCTETVHCRGWCHRHYNRWRRHGDPLAGRRTSREDLPACSVPGCTMETQRIITGLCENHYARERRGTVPVSTDLLVVRGRPVQRFWARVDQDGPVNDYRPALGRCWLWLGKPEGKGYGQHKVNGVFVMAHRFAYELLVGPIPDGLELDHLCRVKLCVRPAHLEPVTSTENTRRAAHLDWYLTAS